MGTGFGLSQHKTFPFYTNAVAGAVVLGTIDSGLFTLNFSQRKTFPSYANAFANSVLLSTSYFGLSTSDFLIRTFEE